MKLYMDDKVPPEVLALATRLGLIIKALPDPDLGRDAQGGAVLASCHILARALAPLFPVLRVIDGRFLACDHSWFFLMAADHSRWIIDVYPVGIAVPGPLVVDFSLLGLFRLYDSKHKPTFPENTPAFAEAVARLAEAARAINDTLPPLA